MNWTTLKRYFSWPERVWPLLGLFLVALPLAASTVRVYVTYEDPKVYHGRVVGDIVVIDDATHKIVQRIKGVDSPYGIEFSPDKKRMYISSYSPSYSENMLDVVDTETGEIIKKVPLSGQPNTIALTKDGGRVFVGIRQQSGTMEENTNNKGIRSRTGALDVIDTTSLERVRTIHVNGGLHDIYLTPDGKYVVAGSEEGQLMDIVDVNTEQLVWEVKFHGNVGPSAIEANPDGSTRRIFVMHHGLRGFAVVDFAQHEVVAEIKLPETEIGKKTPVTDITQCHGGGVSPDNKTFWINSEFDHAVFVYSLPDLKLLGSVPLGNRPNWMTFSPDGKRAYDLNTDDSTMSIIDTKTLKEIARMPIEHQPSQRIFKVVTLGLP